MSGSFEKRYLEFKKKELAKNKDLSFKQRLALVLDIGKRQLATRQKGGIKGYPKEKKQEVHLKKKHALRPTQIDKKPKPAARLKIQQKRPSR